MKYRPEVDGLRTVAVFSVMFFHAGFSAFSGGFVGVDVFFVISGYLITGILLTDLKRGDFSIVKFYERRVRRIMPALFLVVLVSIPVAWYVLLPSDMLRFAHSVVAVFTFSSNILFKRESGYFDTDSELKPLLHTWSLSVEEQYYIIYPVILILIYKINRRLLPLALSILAGICFFVAQRWVGSKPEAAFFLLPSRAWELLVGAGVALYCRQPQYRKVLPQRIWGGIAFTGLAMIVAATLLFDGDTQFPGFAALLPTLGTAAVIASASADNAVGRFLAWRPMVGLGLLSYSAYLWHQPIFAFVRHQAGTELGGVPGIGLVGLAFALAYLSWRYVERPFRDRTRCGRRFAFLLTLLSAGAFIGFGVLAIKRAGFESNWISRQNPETAGIYRMLSVERSVNDMRARRGGGQDDGECRFNLHSTAVDVEQRLAACHAKYGPGVLVLGDSHAIDLFGLLLHSSPEEKFIVGMTRAGCRPHTPDQDCDFNRVLDFISRNRVFSGAIYEQAGFYLLRSDTRTGSRKMIADLPLDQRISGIYPNEDYIRAVYEFLSRVGSLLPIVWFGPRVEPHLSAKEILRQGCHHSYSLRPGQYEIYRQLDAVIARLGAPYPKVRYFSQNELFRFDFSRDLLQCDAIFWADGDHFSQAGEERFAGRGDPIKSALSGIRPPAAAGLPDNFRTSRAPLLR